MKKHIIEILTITLAGAALVAMPLSSPAQDAGTNAPASTPAKHKHGTPFHGKLDMVDTNAMTLTVGSRTFQITSETKITKNGQPAILADGVVGQPVSGYYKQDEDGKLTASTVHFGPHAKRQKASSESNTTTNSPPIN